MRHLGDKLETRDYPHLLFGDGPEKSVRYFPDKLPIGIQPFADNLVLVYLVTTPSPMDFRLFLRRHTPLLRVLFKIPPRRASLKAKTHQGIRYKSLTACGLEIWYRYGDSNPGPVAENHVS